MQHSISHDVLCIDDVTLVLESEEELKSFLVKVKEESEKVGLKFAIQKAKIIAFTLITLWQIEEKSMETVTDFIFLVSKVTVDGDCSHAIERYWLPLWKESYDTIKHHIKK